MNKSGNQQEDITLDEIIREYHEERIQSERQRQAETGLIDNPYADPVSESDEVGIEDPEKEEISSENLEKEELFSQSQETSADIDISDEKTKEIIEEIEESEFASEENEESDAGINSESEEPLESDHYPDEEPVQNVEETEPEPAFEQDEDEPEEERPQENKPQKNNVIPFYKKIKNRKKKHVVRKMLAGVIAFFEENQAKQDEPTPTPAEAAKEYREIFQSASTNVRRVLVILLIALYFTFAHWIGLPLPRILQYESNPYGYFFVILLLQCLAMFFSEEILAVGWKNLKSLHPSGETILLFSSFATLLHIVTVFLFPSWGGLLPYFGPNILALYFSLWARSALARGKYISLRIAAQTNPYSVTRQNHIIGNSDAFVKRRETETDPFVRSVQEEDLAHSWMSSVSGIILVGIIVLSFVASIGKGHPENFFWALSAISSAAAAGSTALAGAQPYLRMCRRLKTFGVAVGGRSALMELSRPAALLLLDDDLFPTGSVSFNGMKLFHGYDVQKVISYAYNLTVASGNHLGELFLDVVKGSHIRPMQVEELSFYEAGGISGVVEGDRILIGNPNFMRRSGVHLPDNIAVDYALLVAFNYELAAVFAVNYIPAGSVTRILPQLTDGNVNLVLATRDFNITPELLHQKYRLDLRHLEMPTIEQRVELSDENVIMEGEPLAFIINEGLSSYAETIITSRRTRKISRFNIILSMIANIFALILMGFMAAAGAFSSASPCNLVLYMILWIIPYVLTSEYIGR